MILCTSHTKALCISKSGSSRKMVKRSSLHLLKLNHPIILTKRQLLPLVRVFRLKDIIFMLLKKNLLFSLYAKDWLFLFVCFFVLATEQLSASGGGRKSFAHVENPERYLFNPSNPYFEKTLTKTNTALVKFSCSILQFLYCFFFRLILVIKFCLFLGSFKAKTCLLL